MKRVLKWIGIVAGALAGLIVIILVGALIASQVMLAKTYPEIPSPLRANTNTEAIAQGAHLIAIAGCRVCHGNDLSGAKLDFAGLDTPNLTVLSKSYSDADFDRALRHCVRPDGKSSVIMPCAAYAALTDNEAAAIIGYLRTLQPTGVASSQIHPGPLLRLALVAGQIRRGTDDIALLKPPINLGSHYEAGRHLARLVCGECHEPTLNGNPLFPSPNLVIVAAYGRSDFHTLMRTGKALGGREVGKMSEAARVRFKNLTDEEVDAIYQYLFARAKAAASGVTS
ncbi:MAG TPA: c-type cytochrome [Steroidobacteraceae bacterium]